jgi:hypothetical protein
MGRLQQRAAGAREGHAKELVDARQASALAADEEVALTEAKLELATLQARTAPAETAQTGIGSETPETIEAQTAGRRR